MGGGITSSVLSMVDATPEIDHHLYARARTAHDIGIELTERFSSVHVIPDNPLTAMLELRRLARHLFPDVIHAHSSIAGALVRLAALDRPRIVYSPHCFAFERRDITGVARRVYTAVERSLATRTDLFVAVAPRELDLAAALGYRRTAYVPNRTMCAPVSQAHYRRPLRIVTAGRICGQKDWLYLVHLKRYIDRHIGVEAVWEWVGGGDAVGEAELGAVGIEVSGWLSQEEMLARMAQAQVYVHTAAWEAAPISILESASIGLPLAIRAIPPLESLRLPGLAADLVQLAGRVASLAEETAWLDAQRASYAIAATHSREWQGRHLLDAYTEAGALPPVALS